MVSQSGFHRGGDAKGHMHAAEVVPGHIESNGGFKVRQLLAETVHQSRESPQVHSEVKVRPFNVTGADVREIEIAADWGWDRLNDFGGAVPVRASVVRLAVQLNQLGKVNVCPEVTLYCRNVRPEPVRSCLVNSHDAGTI